ncbi:AbrB/MazE/SpoVT family DNA-binding domain-containing protein [Candidatus Woesearchaeota archaeon]|nr:AbrB/MazE/SpoVT family DNA-binding domain-containing protein [Candidatus Woesearchaeota archaeon]
MLTINRKVGPKGQIVLPKDVRSQFKWKPGTEVSFIVRAHEVAIQPAMSADAVLEKLHKIGEKIKPMTIKEMKDIFEEEYEDR